MVRNSGPAPEGSREAAAAALDEVPLLRGDALAAREAGAQNREGREAGGLGPQGVKGETLGPEPGASQEFKIARTETARGTDGDAPAVNQFRDVGRNDPCPCGSGKKFKKCCLAA